MKIKGQRPAAPKAEIVVIPREGEDIIITCNPVFDFEDFNKLCPMPKPPIVTHKNGESVTDVTDVKFQDKLMTRSRRRTAWLILESLKGTPELEWDTVVANDPTTWENIYTELKEAQFSDLETHYIVNAVMTACAMDESKLDEARRRFTHSLQDQNDK
jgi:hypothetical protein